MMRFAAGTLDRAFQIKEKGIIIEILGRDSGLTDVFYCHGMVGVFVMLYLQQIELLLQFEKKLVLIHYV